MNSAVKSVLALALGITVGAVSAQHSWAAASYGISQDTQQASKPAASRLIGTVTGVQGNDILLKTDAGETATLTVNDQTRIVRTLPGQKSLAGATSIPVTDIQVGDRILSRTTPSADGKSYMASMVIAMKQSDIAQKQQEEKEAWRRNGIGGLVQAVDPAAKTITVSSHQSGSTVIHLTPNTILRRYAPDSIEFQNAKPAPLAEIKPGDQLRARGTLSEDKKDFTADEIVSGSFRNIAATVLSVDAADKTLTLNDLISKKHVTLHLTADSQLHKLPAQMAEMLATRLKGGAHGAAPGNEHAAMVPSSGAAQGNHTQGMEAPHQGPADLQQMLTRAPTISLADLKKGDALMVVSTEGSGETPATVVMLVAGVEPMFQASTSASQNLLSSWSLSSGEGGGGSEAQ